MEKRPRKPKTFLTPYRRARMLNRLLSGEINKQQAQVDYGVVENTINKWLRRRRAVMSDVDLICLAIKAEMRKQSRGAANAI